MRLTLGRKLAAVLLLLSSVAAGISAFALFQTEQERSRSEVMEAVWGAALQARTLAHAIEHAVVEATAVFTADDTAEAKGRFAALQVALTEVDKARTSFLSAMETQLSPDDRRKLDLAIKEFVAYQTDTAELGLTISPKAALIQATDEATIKNRQRMLAQITRLGEETLAQLANGRDSAARARRQATVALITAPLCVIAVALVAALWIVVTQIQRPLARLGAVMKGLAEERLDGQVPFTARRDEVGEMARAIATFQIALADKQALDLSTRERAALDVVRAGRLAEATDLFQRETQEVVAALARSASEMHVTSEVLTAAAGQTTEQAGTVVSASDRSTAMVSTIASAAEELSASAREIGARVHQTSEIAGSALAEARSLNTTVGRLTQAASEIGAVVTLIRTIADQTNLLALNATIEAARAGAAGRGFAVVAAEVKALAGQTASATDRITLQVDAIQEAAQGTAEAIGSIGQTIAQVSGIAREVAGAADQQMLASQEIAQSIAGAASQVHAVTLSIANVQQATTSNEEQAALVRRTAAHVSQHTKALQITVSDFVHNIQSA
ncbi:methyl-accepting chemotaxis protein [Methylobacterium sp. DB0501]|jgi:methyl-accepting chemotaxis protein|uniref:methyl-accepting chemotaxis protein n=1 Tax=Methylobacterium sp. DB0501 TaxID=2709665 RepID=UPI0013EB169C|nr:methyl-accepting chemotaxis protein [Methylobacterium sp. DB0501]NGM38508.1 methyl-accepting chemotaxis protein [Methylobacterium sp. DB0501]